MKKKSSFVTAILIAALLAGALLLLYPTVSDYWNSFHQSRAIASYAEQVADLDDTHMTRFGRMHALTMKHWTTAQAALS